MKDSKMDMYLELAQQKSKVFNPFDILQIQRYQNTQADALANLGSSLKDISFAFMPIAHLAYPAVPRGGGKTVATTVEHLQIDDDSNPNAGRDVANDEGETAAMDDLDNE